ncbi:MAG TPA: Calx-beta domain-containing protein [Acidimicrobiia bacterium]
MGALLLITGGLAGTASAASATVKASTSTGLADGQTIRVTGTGYPGQRAIEVVECHRTYGCDLSTSQFTGSGKFGTFNTLYATTRVITASKKSIDCGKTSNCVLVAYNYPQPTAIAETPIMFNPNTPILAKLAVSVSLDGTDGVVTSSGVMVMHGNVTCTRAASLYIDASGEQSSGGSTAQGESESSFTCTKAETIPWQVSVEPYEGAFTTGAAQANVYAEANANRSYAESETNGTVILTSANLPTITPSGAHVTVPGAGDTVVLHYWIVLSAASQFPVSFEYSTLNGTASAPTDYTPASGRVTLAPGVTKAIVPITIQGNNESAGNRTFIVSVTDPTNAVLGGNHGRGVVTLTHP